MGLRSKKSLSGIFIRYIVGFCFIAVLIMGLHFSLFTVMLQYGIILPANYFEQKLEENRSEIIKADKVTRDLIPDGCSYGVYSKNGTMLYGDFTIKQSRIAWKAVKGEVYDNNYYRTFYRKNDICIAKYSIGVQFSSQFLRKYFPNIGFMEVIVFILFIIGEVVLLSAVFARYVSREMKILMEAADNVKERNLDFKPKHSNIREIEEVIVAFDDMKDELRTSLEKQWNMEELRKNEISALAHDIKTPLTIIKGNAELMKENLSHDINLKYNDYILKSTDEIEKYLKILIDIVKSEDSITLKKVKIKTKMFFQRIVDKENALASEKNLDLISEMESVPEFFYGDEELLYRAIMNVISNAIEYSPKFGKLVFKIYGCKNELEFSIEDSGHGFSKEELQFAAEQFYRGDKSRISNNHYGMGLFITSSFIKLSGGIMKLSNSEQIGGAKVVLKVPLLPESITTN